MSLVRQFGEIRDPESGDVLVQMFGPGRSDDIVSIGLRMLTQQLQDIRPNDDHGWSLLGGAFGGGVDFENDTFLMHHYCWCEKEDCLWCGGRCGCPDGEMEYFLDDQPIPNWWEANEAIVATLPMYVAKHGTPEYEEAQKLKSSLAPSRWNETKPNHAPISGTGIPGCPPK